MDNKFCSKCKQEFAEKDRYCANCGTSRAKRRIVYGDANYCTKCGSKVYSTGGSTQNKLQEYVATNREPKGERVTNIVFAVMLIFFAIVCILALEMPFFGTYDAVSISGDNISGQLVNGFDSQGLFGISLYVSIMIVFGIIGVVFAVFKLIISSTVREGAFAGLHNRSIAWAISLITCLTCIVLAALAIVVFGTVMAELSKASSGKSSIIEYYSKDKTHIGLYMLIISSVVLLVSGIVVGVKSYVKYKAPII